MIWEEYLWCEHQKKEEQRAPAKPFQRQCPAKEANNCGSVEESPKSRILVKCAQSRHPKIVPPKNYLCPILLLATGKFPLLRFARYPDENEAFLEVLLSHPPKGSVRSYCVQIAWG
ncbi:hypothetical protein BT69DRAFT_1284778 [Atractiella rhizophila]|nr:hypothetical protein BT69DRAFT_1284778 [Atractiella rhizophila]